MPVLPPHSCAVCLRNMKALRKARSAVFAIWFVSLAAIVLIGCIDQMVVIAEPSPTPPNVQDRLIFPAPPRVHNPAEFTFEGSATVSTGTLSASIQSISADTEEVTIGGVDSQCPSDPFMFDWGDGQQEFGWLVLLFFFSLHLRLLSVLLQSHTF